MADSSRLLRALRLARPASVVAVADGEERALALRSGKGRWESIVETVSSLGDSVERVELRDAKGAVLRIWTPEEAPAAPPPPAVVVEPARGGLAEAEAFALRLLAVVQEAQRSAVAQQLEVMRASHDAMSTTLKTLAERVSQNERNTTQMLRALYEGTRARAEADAAAAVAAAGGGEGSPLDAMASAVLQGALGGGLPPGLDIGGGNGAASGGASH